MKKIEITKEHCRLFGDLFINDCMGGKKIDEITIPEMERYLGKEKAVISISLGLQKAGLDNSMFAGNIASKLVGYEGIKLTSLDTDELEEKQEKK